MARHRPATLVHPGPPRHLVRRRRAAQPRDRAPERAPRQLGPEGRLLPAGEHGRARPIRTRPTRSPDAGKVDNPGQRVPVRERGASPPASARRRSPGKPYPIKGWFVYATNLIQALPNEAETIRAIQAARPAGRGGRDPAARSRAGPTSCCPRRRTSSATTSSTSSSSASRSWRCASRSWTPPGDQKPNWWIARELAREARPRGLLPLEDDRGVPRPPPEGRRASASRS